MYIYLVYEYVVCRSVKKTVTEKGKERGRERRVEGGRGDNMLMCEVDKEEGKQGREYLVK